MNSFQHAILKNSKLLFFIGIISLSGLSSNSRAELKELFNPSGSIRLAGWSKNKEFSDDRNFLVGSGWLTLRPQEVSGYKFYFDGFIQGQDLHRRSYTEGDLREAFVEKTYGIFDVKAGRAITAWGRADKFNPTDSFAYKNLKLLMTDDEDQRSGLGSLQIITNFEEYRLISIWLPEWRTPIYPIQPTTGIHIQSENPRNSASQFALKLDRSGGETDWSVSYFQGYNRIPDLKVSSLTSQGLFLELQYQKIHVYGADFSTNFGEYGLRGEIAWTQTIDSEGSQPLAQNSNLTAALGADRTFDGNLNINAQVLAKTVDRYQSADEISDSTTKALAQQLALNSNQTDAQVFGSSLRTSYKMLNETLELEIAAVVWFKKSDSFVRPKVSYAISDTMKAIVGAEVYSGPSDSFWGRLQDTSSSYAEIRYLF